MPGEWRGEERRRESLEQPARVCFKVDFSRPRSCGGFQESGGPSVLKWYVVCLEEV